MWPGLADNDESSSPARVRENHGCYKRGRERVRLREERDGMRQVDEGRKWREKAW